MIDAMDNMYDRWVKDTQYPESEPSFLVFQAGWEACIQHEKDQLAKSLAEFDNDNNDCGSGGCIL